MYEYERMVVYRYGRLRKEGHLGPGTVKILKDIDKVGLVVDLRELFTTVRIREYTRERIPLEMIIVIFYDIYDPVATVSLEGFPAPFLNQAKVLISAQIREHKLSEILRDKRTLQLKAKVIFEFNNSFVNLRLILFKIKEELEKFMIRWGIRIRRFEIYSITVPNENWDMEDNRAVSFQVNF